MTQQQMDNMTIEEIKSFEDSCSVFDESQSLEEYTTSIRDLIYLYRYIDPRRKNYDMELANWRIECNVGSIAKFYDEKEPAAYAAIDVDFCCG